jgi:hypothetical protein
MSSDSGLPTFKQSFKGDIVTPDDEGYTEAIARWSANAERPASLVAFVKDTGDISLALKYARTNKLQVAIRGGGHNPSGASSSKDGLVIDLSRYFDYAVVDPEKRTARVGGGTLWGTVENEAIQHGLASVAGSVNHVRSLRLAVHAALTKNTDRGCWVCPIAFRDDCYDSWHLSLLLGGGVGLLTGQHGLVIDNLLQVRFLAGPRRIISTSHM